MRLFFVYLKHRWRWYATCLIFCLIFVVSFVLFGLPKEAVIYPMIVCIFVGAIFTVADFLRVRRKHEELVQIKSITDIIERTLPYAEGIEENDYRTIVLLLKGEHIDYQTQTDKKYSDMVDYYTIWAHQIKTPLASMRLNLQNEDSPMSRQLYSDLYRVEQYVEMVLTFLRLNSESSDYVIKTYKLDGIIKQAVKKFSHEFIGRKLRLDYHPTSISVITDEKWLSFVIEQILSNALKYTRNGGITIWTDDRNRLYIKDTGIGIAPEDLPRIFENGYTGFNGRTDKKASGIGLYLCRRICKKLEHDISICSVVGEGTTVTIDLARQELLLE